MLTTLPVAEVHRNPSQPRKHFDQAALDELAGSISELGLLQPIIVRSLDGAYQIVAGERRWRATCQAGLTEIPAIVIEADDDRTALLAIAENVNRADMNPIEEASAFAELVAGGREVAEVAELFGKSTTYIHTRLSLMKLDDRIQHFVARGTISMAVAFQLARLSVAGQWRIMDLLTAGEFANDQDTIRGISAVAASESEVVLFDLGDDDVETRREAKAKVDRHLAAAGKAMQALDAIADMGAAELAALDAATLAKLGDWLEVMSKQARSTKTMIAKVAAARTVAA